MATLQDAVTAIAGRNLPVLLPDTCGILDVVRFPIRAASHLMNSFDAVVSGFANNSPKTCDCVISSLIRKEFNDHIQEVVDELDRRLGATEDFVQEVRAACGAVAINSPNQCSLKNLGLSTTLRSHSERVLQHGIYLDEDDAITSRGTKRAIDCRPPARKGQFKDSIIFEEYLEFARRARANGHSAPIVLLSSNTNDYCDGGSRLHPDIATDLASVQMDFAPNWGAARVFLKL